MGSHCDTWAMLLEFSCPLIAYGAGVGTKAQPDKNQEGMGGGGGGDTGGAEVEVTCKIPSHRKVFAGLPGKMSVLTDQAAKVVVVPLSAVLGQTGNGAVTVVGKDNKHEIRKVKLGLNDGTQVEIKEGLEAGEKILDRAPEDPAFSGPGQGATENNKPNGYVTIPDADGGMVVLPSPMPS